MKKRLKLTLLGLCIIILISLSFFGFTFYKLKNIDDSWCPDGFYLKKNFHVFDCNDCQLTLKQIENGVKYKGDEKCRNANKVCYMCEKPPLPECQCTYEFQYVKVSNLEGYLLKLMYN